MRTMVVRAFVLLALACAILQAKVSFSASATRVDVYDFVEVSARTTGGAGNPFVEAVLNGELQHAGEPSKQVIGFSDAMDGSTYRIRFMADQPGAYRYEVTLRVEGQVTRYEGTFEAITKGRRGMLRVDGDYPFHFLWEGTAEHYYWNGLTAYALMGWQDEEEIRAIVDRAAGLKINRLRVSLNGPRVEDASRWYEPVKSSPSFHFLFGPWVGAHPDDVSDPGWDVTRYDVAFWQKYERMVRYARERNVVISVIFFLDGEDAGADPFGKAHAFGEDEKRYYRYAVARLGAYSNVTWDITNEWHLFRSAWWVQEMGTYVKSIDPWKHLASCHGKDQFPWMVSEWPDFAMFQLWDDEGGYRPMQQRRNAQAATGHPMPQINEEYGYEDHYPVKWGGNKRTPARSADNRRQLAWEIAMAGCYQTTGERANGGNGSGSPSPGGWINGGFDASMHMLEGYARIADFFTSFEYWKLSPVVDADGGNVLVLAEPGRRYVVYYRSSEGGLLDLEAGEYRARWYNPRSGEWSESAAVHMAASGTWKTPIVPDGGDWVMLLTKA